MLIAVADFLLGVGAILHGGPLVAFACLMAVAPRAAALDPRAVDRVYRAWGPGSGLALGLMFAAGILKYYLAFSTFRVDYELWARTPFAMAAVLVFLAMWVSYTVLEVWVLEPLRRTDGAGGAIDEAAYLALRRPAVRHVIVNACLFLLVVLLATLGKIW